MLVLAELPNTLPPIAGRATLRPLLKYWRIRFGRLLVMPQSRHMEDQQKHVIGANLRAFETELGLPDGFLDRLLFEDDWSFVIKAHALIEGTITHLLTGAVDARLGKVFSRLELSGADTGKLVFAESLGLIDSTERNFIRRFSELRNKLVHDVRQVSFTFEAYFATLDKNQLSSFSDAVSAFFASTPDKQAFKTVVFQRPRLAMWSVTMQVLTRALGESQRVKALALFRTLKPSDLGQPH